MKTTKIFAISIIFPFILSCSTVHMGHQAFTIEAGEEEHISKKGIVISGYKNYDVSDDYVLIINFTLENISANWTEVEKVELDFGPYMSEIVSFLDNSRVLTWRHSQQERQAISNYNTKLFSSSMIALGLVTAAAGGASTSSNSGMIAGAGMAAAGTGLMTMPQTSPRQNSSGNIRDGAFEIPPGGVVKKWTAIQVHSPVGFEIISYVKLLLTYKDGTQEGFSLPFWDDTPPRDPLTQIGIIK